MSRTLERPLGCTENNNRRRIVHSCEQCCGVCATGIWAEMYESYLESVLLTQSDQSQHLKQNKWVDTDASSHSTALYGGPTLCCAAAALPLLGCACSAAPAPTQCWPQYCAKPLEDMQLCWQDCSIPGLSCLFGDMTLAELSCTRSASPFEETVVLLESCRNELAPVLPGNKISLPKLPPLWADLKQLLLIIWCFSSYQKCSFKHMPSYFNEHPSSNCFKCMVSRNEILTCILNMPRSISAGLFWKLSFVIKKCGLLSHTENTCVPFLGMWSQSCSQWIYSKVPPDFSMHCRI